LRLVGASVLALALVGCNGGDTTSKEPAAGNVPHQGAPGQTPAGTPLKVALLTPGEVSDSGWSAMAYNGLQAVKQKIGADVSNKVSTGENIAEDMRSYAQQGYGLVFGHGYEYNAPAIKVAKDFPNTVFVSSSGGETAPNVGAFRFFLEEGFYLAGMMAGKMTKTGTIAEVGGVPNIPSIESTFKAFEAGAKSVRPNIVIKKVYANSFDDTAKAKQATETVIGQGADFIIHQANNAAQGVFDAAKEKGVYAIGANADQNGNVAGSVIASATIVADPAFVSLAIEVQSGHYKGEIQTFGMKQGAIDFVINPKLKDKVPADVQKLIAETKDKIAHGGFEVPKDKF
ncbi:MAG TPA: BMP family protein, partial [Fimbriimonadaceae bacterium]|nr:BMP family protein [Fimbriimonadaceae bacterium]